MKKVLRLRGDARTRGESKARFSASNAFLSLGEAAWSDLGTVLLVRNVNGVAIRAQYFTNRRYT